MKKVRITAIRKTCYPDLMEKYENPIQHACEVKEGQVWLPTAGASRRASVAAPGTAFRPLSWPLPTAVGISTTVG